MTAHPTAAWVWRQLVEATAWGRRPKHLIRDRDRVYGGDFPARAKALGSDTGLTPVRASRANAIAERVIGTLRRECLDHGIPLNDHHLHTILVEVVSDDNRNRPHRMLRLEAPQSPSRPRAGPLRSVHARPVLVGLHHVYDYAA